MSSVGENDAKPQSRVQPSNSDSTDTEYTPSGNSWQALRLISAGTKRSIDGWRPQIIHLTDLLECHNDAALFLRKRVHGKTTLFQHLVVANHLSASVFLKDSLHLVQIGSLASSTVLLRPVVEILLELQYLRRFPNEAETYFDRIEKRTKRPSGGKAAGSPPGTLRFKPVEEMIKPLRSRKSHVPDSFDDRLIDQWQLLTDTAANPSPELLGVSQGRQQAEWRETLGVLEQVAFDAAKQLFEIDEDFARLFDQEQVLHRRVLNLSFSGAGVTSLG